MKFGRHMSSVKIFEIKALLIIALKIKKVILKNEHKRKMYKNSNLIKKYLIKYGKNFERRGDALYCLVCNQMLLLMLLLFHDM